MEKNDEYSTSVDEEIEILDYNSKANALPPSNPASNETTQISISSGCSAPPGFTVKGKYTYESLTVASTKDPLIDTESLTAWKQHFASGSKE